jgi:RHS repeat-associated protein
MDTQVPGRCASAAGERTRRQNRLPFQRRRAARARLSDRSRPRLRRSREHRQTRRLPSVPPHHGDADARRRRRHPLHPGDARACGPENHSNLHACVDPPASGDPSRHPSRQSRTRQAHSLGRDRPPKTTKKSHRPDSSGPAAQYTRCTMPATATSVLPLAAVPLPASTIGLQLSEKPHQGFAPSKTPSRQAWSAANSLNASGIGECVYDPGRRTRSTGKERDQETGLDNFGARYYSGAQGRFTGPDQPLIDQNPVDPQSWNLYSYGRNNPLRFTDPTGRACIDNGHGGWMDDNGPGGTCLGALKGDIAERKNPSVTVTTDDPQSLGHEMAKRVDASNELIGIGGLVSLGGGIVGAAGGVGLGIDATLVGLKSRFVDPPPTQTVAMMPLLPGSANAGLLLKKGLASEQQAGEIVSGK